MGLGAFPGNDPQFLGMLGMHGTVEANNAMHEADVIFAVGARFDDRVTNTPSKFCPSAKIIHIDVDPTSISKTVNIDIPIVGVCSTVLRQMIEEIKTTKDITDKIAISDWWSKINGWRERHGIYTEPRHEPSSGNIIKPQDVIRSLYKATNGDAFITSDVGQHLSLIHI